MDYFKDGLKNYFTKNKVAVIFLIVCLAVIFLSSFIASGIQSDGWTVEVTDLRDETNEGTKDVVTVVDDVETVKTETIKYQEILQNLSKNNKTPQINKKTVNTEDYYQMSLEDALKNNELTRRKIKEKLKQKEALWDGGTTMYVSPKENITFVLCQTTDGNKDIYVGNKDMRYEESFCK